MSKSYCAGAAATCVAATTEVRRIERKRRSFVSRWFLRKRIQGRGMGNIQRMRTEPPRSNESSPITALIAAGYQPTFFWRALVILRDFPAVPQYLQLQRKPQRRISFFPGAATRRRGIGRLVHIRNLSAELSRSPSP